MKTEAAAHTALVLCGDGARGAMQVGFYQAIVELGLSFDLVIGSSVGALNGALISACGVSDAMPYLALVHTSIEHSRDWCSRLLKSGCQEPSAQRALSPVSWCSRLLKTTPGTENVPAIVGFGAAAKMARERLPETTAHLGRLRDRLHTLLADAIPGLTLNGHPDERLPNTLHVSFPGVSGRALLQAASTDVAASVGSACHSEHDTVSGVLAAMGVNSIRAAGAVRLSVGTMTSAEDITQAAAALVEAWRQLTRQ
ncbi:MAG: aminotransferase class V-fold PLP-dependent enzyme [Gammaproteobacteria bacterium]|nr:aminotransferase class V-fold PLP-dependent enzyme [Gammaproteobacteria bacterium]